MKTSITYLLAISLLLQSCYTYRTIDLKDTAVVVGKNYKIRQDAKFVKSKLETVNDSTITLVRGHIRKVIKISEIQEIKESKFSTLKTVGLGLGIGLVGVVIVGTIEMSDFDLYDPLTY